MARIRDAQVADAVGIATVHVRSWQTTYVGIMPEPFLQSLSIEKRADAWEKGLQNPIEGGFQLVAEHGGEIVGFASGGPQRGDLAGHTGELYAIYLLKEHQGRGTGRALVQDCFRRLKAMGHTKMLVWVARENHAARSFYERMGGQFLAEKADELAGQPLPEVAYSYDLNQVE